MHKRILTLLAALAVFPVYAADSTGAAPAAAQPAAAGKPNEPTVTPTTTPAAHATGTVSRAQFTTGMQNREPVDKITTLSNDKTQIYFFSEIKDAANQKITHRWEYNGKAMSEVSFDVGSNRWRVFSSKTLDPSWTGEWKVSVVDDSGSTLGVSTFTYEKSSTPSTSESASPTPDAAPAAAEPKKP